MAHSWLQRQRKQTILDLSQEAGLKQDEDLRKDELIEQLHSHLQANATRLSRNSAFENYYGPRSSTPYKPRESAADIISDEVKSVVKGKGRKTTKVKQELEESAEAEAVRKAVSGASSSVSALVPSSTTLSKATEAASQAVTPAVKRIRQSIPGPPSPSVIADAVEQASNKYLGSASKLYTSSGFPERISTFRTYCSSVTSVQLTVLFLEAFALQRVVMPLRYAFDTPAIPAIGISSTAVSLPDVFALLTPRYWSTTLLWAATSILIPALIAYFYNLSVCEVKRNGVRVTVPRYSTDPLSFNVAKALVCWLVYAKGVGAGSLVAAQTIARVDSAIYGGYTGMLVASGIGALAALYEAAQAK